MTLEEAKRQFKKHYRYAMKLKEGGKAWEREMKLCQRYKAIGIAKYNQKLKERYGY